MSDTQLPPQLSTDSVPQPPRPLTGKVRKRLLSEPTVRFWWILAALIFVTFIVTGIRGIMQWQSEARVIASGPVVKAIGFGEGARIKGRPLAVNATVYIDYEYQGRKYKSQGPLVPTGELYMAGEPFDIRLDPDDPSVWTNRNKAATLREKLIGTVITLFFGAICVIAGLFARRQYVSVWTDGSVCSGKVVEHRQMALAPRSTAVRCAMRVGRNDSLVTVYLPHSATVPEVGQPIQLISNDAGGRAIALVNYV